MTLDELKNKIDEIQAKSAVAPEMKAFILLVLSVIKDAKNDIENLSGENLQTIKDSIDYIDRLTAKTEQTIDTTNSKFKAEIDGKISEIKGVLKEAKNIPPQIIEKTEIIREIPIVTNEIKEVAIPETGEDIVDKINALSTDPENQIDAKHIKNLPAGRGVGGSTARNLYQLQDTNVLEPKHNEVLQYDSTNNLWKNGYAITVSETEPTDPKQFDLWLDIS